MMHYDPSNPHQHYTRDVSMSEVNMIVDYVNRMEFDYTEMQRRDVLKDKRLDELERELAAAQATIASDATFIKQLGETCNAAEKEAIALRTWKAKMVSAYERGIEISYDGRTGERDGVISLLLEAIRERDAARLPSAPTP